MFLFFLLSLFGRFSYITSDGAISTKYYMYKCTSKVFLINQKNAGYRHGFGSADL